MTTETEYKAKLIQEAKIYAEAASFDQGKIPAALLARARAVFTWMFDYYSKGNQHWHSQMLSIYQTRMDQFPQVAPSDHLYRIKDGIFYECRASGINTGDIFGAQELEAMEAKINSWREKNKRKQAIKDRISGLRSEVKSGNIIGGHKLRLG